MTSPHRGLRIGVIAEDKTDCETLQVLIAKLRGRATDVKIQHGNGGGIIKVKGASWIRMLESKGCSAVIIVHDLDRDRQTGQLNDEAVLQSQLARIAVPKAIARHICIPVEELEAWFWADEQVLRAVAPLKVPVKALERPEKLRDPKGALMRLSRDGGKKPRYATTDNAALAKELDVNLCAQRCPSFAKLRDFVATL